MFLNYSKHTVSMSDAVTLGAPDSMEGTKFRETDKHIVGFGIFIGFVKKIQ